MDLSISEVLAILAVIISTISVFYAKHAIHLAVEANRVSLHQPRAEIFKAIFEYRALFVDMDLHPNDDEMQDFYLRAILPAHLYLPAHFTKRMHEIYTRSRDLYSQIDICESGEGEESKWVYINQLQELGKGEVDRLINDLAEALDLGNT